MHDLVELCCPSSKFHQEWKHTYRVRFSWGHFAPGCCRKVSGSVNWIYAEREEVDSIGRAKFSTKSGIVIPENLKGTLRTLSVLSCSSAVAVMKTAENWYLDNLSWRRQLDGTRLGTTKRSIEAVLCVIMQEGAPRLRRVTATSDHASHNRCLRYIESEFVKLTMYSGCTPERVGLGHVTD